MQKIHIKVFVFIADLVMFKKCHNFGTSRSQKDA